MSEDIITLAWNKIENSKKELQRNWTYQIIVVGLSIGLFDDDVAKAISTYLFGESGHEKILYFVLPVLSIYLFIRLGAQLSQFIEVRELSAKILEGNTDKKHLSKILTTTSFFETFFSRNVYSRKFFNCVIAIYTFSIFVIVLSVGHICSVYFILKLPAEFKWQVFWTILYMAPIVALYVSFSWGFRNNKYTMWTIIFTFIITMIGGAWVLPEQFNSEVVHLLGVFHA